MPDTLDDVLNNSAPNTPPLAGERRAAISAMVAEARKTVALERRRKITRRSVGAVGVFALMGLGTAAAAGVLPGQSQFPAWTDLTDEAAQTAQVFEWTSTHPEGQVCVERLMGWGLTDDQVAGIREALSDPAQLLADDDGAVRQEFLDRGWENGSPEDSAAMDAAYAEVANIDFAKGRGSLADDELTADFMSDRYDEIFNTVYTRLILDGIGAGPHHHGENPAMDSIESSTACVVTE